MYIASIVLQLSRGLPECYVVILLIRYHRCVGQLALSLRLLGAAGIRPRAVSNAALFSLTALPVCSAVKTLPGLAF